MQQQRRSRPVQTADGGRPPRARVGDGWRYCPCTCAQTSALAPQTGRDAARALATGTKGTQMTHSCLDRDALCTFVCVQKKQSAVIAKTFVANPHIATLTRLASEQGSLLSLGSTPCRVATTPFALRSDVQGGVAPHAHAPPAVQNTLHPRAQRPARLCPRAGPGRRATRRVSLVVPWPSGRCGRPRSNAWCAGTRTTSSCRCWGDILSVSACTK